MVVRDEIVAQTKMTISQRGPVHGVECDVVCTGRFFDFLEKRGEKWGIVLRQPIYEKDRIDPIDPAAVLTLDQAKPKRYPGGYRHLAYIQEEIGYDAKRDMPGLKGREVRSCTTTAAIGSAARCWNCELPPDDCVDHLILSF